MIINRIFDMPNRWTFLIPSIKIVLEKYVGDGKGWIDPFAGENSPAEITNDIDPQRKAKYHLESLEFAKQLSEESFKGVLFDPPYSLEQCKRSYESVQRKFTMRDSQICGRWTELKERLGHLIKPNGMAISFGWNTAGFGKKNGFEIIEILIINHGAAHYDTLVTVEKKVQCNLL